MNFSFHPEAEREFDRSINDYESIETGLCYDFAIEVYSAIQRVVEIRREYD